MNLDPEEISSKNSTVVFILTFFFGALGLHRFYVGKWKSGLIYLEFGSILPGVKIIDLICKIIGVGSIIKIFWFIILAFVLVVVACLYDIFTLYSESFTDSKGKIVISGSRKDEIVGRTLEEKFNDKLDTIVALFAFLLFTILYLIALSTT